jgi:hypothetical protein
MPIRRVGENLCLPPAADPVFVAPDALGDEMLVGLLMHNHGQRRADRVLRDRDPLRKNDAHVATQEDGACLDGSQEAHDDGVWHEARSIAFPDSLCHRSGLIQQKGDSMGTGGS